MATLEIRPPSSMISLDWNWEEKRYDGRASLTFLSEEALQQAKANGLEVGCRVKWYGHEYEVTGQEGDDFDLEPV